MIKGIDIDGVLAQFDLTYFKHFNMNEDIPVDWYDKRFDYECFKQIEHDKDFWMSLPKLIEPEELPYKIDYYVTARSIDSKVTEKWLELNGFPRAPVITVGHDVSKVEAIKKYKIELFVDDAPHNFIDIKNNTSCDVYLLDKPYNKSVSAGNKRIYSLNELKSNGNKLLRNT